MDQAWMMMKNCEEISCTSEDLITTSSCHSWKLYENAFYNPQNHHQNHEKCQCNKQRKNIAAAIWDLTLLRSIMETDLELARAQMIEVKAELEFERKARTKAESIIKKLANELNEEKRVCEELAREISSSQGENDRMKREIEEERKMLRIAQVLREERVQMKLSDAKILFEERLLKLEKRKLTDQIPNRKISGLVFGERCREQGYVASREAENPHIKRGIKGNIEFPRVMKAIGSSKTSSRKHHESQLKILIKQKSPIIRFNSLILS